MSAPRLVGQTDLKSGQPSYRIEVSTSRFILCDVDELRALSAEIIEALEGTHDAKQL